MPFRNIYDKLGLLSRHTRLSLLATIIDAASLHLSAHNCRRESTRNTPSWVTDKNTARLRPRSTRLTHHNPVCILSHQRAVLSVHDPRNLQPSTCVKTPPTTLLLFLREYLRFPRVHSEWDRRSDTTQCLELFCSCSCFLWRVTTALMAKLFSGEGER